LLALPGPGLSWKTGSLEVARSGDIAYETGAYDFVITDKNGKSSDAKGKYVVVWKKQTDGSWKVVVDTDNPDQ
jgi:ketosteroid isomerase-like protein